MKNTFHPKSITKTPKQQQKCKEKKSKSMIAAKKRRRYKEEDENLKKKKTELISLYKLKTRMRDRLFMAFT